MSLSAQPFAAADLVRRIAIVGNAPGGDDLSGPIDAADRVVRFNNAFGFGTTRGARIDDLYLVNAGGQPREWLETPAFWQRPVLRHTPHVTLPIPVEDAPPQDVDPDGRNFGPELRDRLTAVGKRVEILGEAHRTRAVSELMRFGARADVTPSTGFLATVLYRARAPEGAVIELFGFGFEGWPGHDWAAERRWVQAAARAGRLIWHAPSGSGGTGG